MLPAGGYTPAIVDPQSGDVYFGDIEGANGDMGDNETAAFDPIFFVHHSNIDRLFWVWQKKWGRINVINISKNLEGMLIQQLSTKNTSGGNHVSFWFAKFLSTKTCNLVNLEILIHYDNY